MPQGRGNFAPILNLSNVDLSRVAVLSGTPALTAEMSRGLSIAQFTSSINLTLIIDAPVGFAFTQADHFVIMPTIVLTDNNCPEYLLDLRATECTAVLAGGNSFQDILLSLERVVSGQRFYRGPEVASQLTKSERLILQYVSFGLSDKRIAHQLSKSERTVSNQVGSVLSKLKLKSRGQAMLYYLSLNHILESFS